MTERINNSKEKRRPLAEPSLFCQKGSQRWQAFSINSTALLLTLLVLGGVLISREVQAENPFTPTPDHHYFLPIIANRESLIPSPPAVSSQTPTPQATPQENLFPPTPTAVSNCNIDRDGHTLCKGTVTPETPTPNPPPDCKYDQNGYLICTLPTFLTPTPTVHY